MLLSLFAGSSSGCRWEMFPVFNSPQYFTPHSFAQLTDVLYIRKDHLNLFKCQNPFISKRLEIHLIVKRKKN